VTGQPCPFRREFCLPLLAGLVLTAISPCSFGVPVYLSLFESARARAIAGAERQKARRRLAEAEYDRGMRVSASGAISWQELDQLKTAEIASQFDLEIAEIRAKESTISYDLARALARHGLPIPQCVRSAQTDENTVSPLLKRRKEYRSATVSFSNAPADGTQVQVSDGDSGSASTSAPDISNPSSNSITSVAPLADAADTSGADAGGPPPSAQQASNATSSSKNSAKGTAKNNATPPAKAPTK
jgi:hypothetical protein